MSPQVIPAPDLAARGFHACRCGDTYARKPVGWACPKCKEPSSVTSGASGTPRPASADAGSSGGSKHRPGQATEDALAALLTELGCHVAGLGEYLWRVEKGDVGDLGIVAQYPWGLTVTPQRRFRADFAQPSRRTLLEVDGGAHRATEKRRRHDVVRRQLAEAAGYRVLAVLPEQVKDRTALALLKKALGFGEDA